MRLNSRLSLSLSLSCCLSLSLSFAVSLSLSTADALTHAKIRKDDVRVAELAQLQFQLVDAALSCA